MLKRRAGVFYASRVHAYIHAIYGTCYTIYFNTERGTQVIEIRALSQHDEHYNNITGPSHMAECQVYHAR